MGLAVAVALPMLAWVSTYLLNVWLFSAVEWADGIDWVFLPAAVRLISVLMFGPLGALGLFLGGLFTMVVVEDALWSKALPIAASSALAPLLAVTAVLNWLRLPPTLTGLGTSQLALLATASAASSVALHNVYYWLSEHRSDPLSGLLPMFIGDIVGSILVFYLLRTGLRAHARLRSVRSG